MVEGIIMILSQGLHSITESKDLVSLLLHLVGKVINPVRETIDGFRGCQDGMTDFLNDDAQI
jgi:hypothetical protein